MSVHARNQHETEPGDFDPALSPTNLTIVEDTTVDDDQASDPHRNLFHKALYQPLPADEQPEVTGLDLRGFNAASPEDVTRQALSTMLLRLAGDAASYQRTGATDVDSYGDMAHIVGDYQRSFADKYVPAGKLDIDKLEDLYPDDPQLEHPGLNWLAQYAPRIRQGGKAPERILRHMLTDPLPEDTLTDS